MSIQWDNAVEGTSDDAAISKLSAATLGYFDDKFMTYFVGRKKFIRRSPIINRGYFARVAARDEVVTQFLDLCNKNCQILSLGAGSDTLYFRLASRGLKPKRYVEVDLAGVVVRKQKIIAQTEELNSLVDNEVYSLFEADIVKVDDLQKKLSKLENFDFNLPTLILSECVLVYLEPENSMKILKMISKEFQNSSIFVYEQVRPDDAFGKVMMENLRRRGCPLKGLVAHRSPEMQIDRFKNIAGFSHCECFDMNKIYYEVLPKPLINKIEKLEIFDEFEEWHIMSAHYAIVLAKNISNSNVNSPLHKLSLMPTSK